MPKPATRSLGWCLALLALTAAAPPPPVVATRAGKVEGVSRDGIHAYLGIPFAAPPVGPNRWRAPQPPQPWTGAGGAAAVSASKARHQPRDRVAGLDIFPSSFRSGPRPGRARG